MRTQADEDAAVVSLAAQLQAAIQRGNALVESIDNYNKAHDKPPAWQFWR